MPPDPDTIVCPICNWRPNASTHWQCECGHQWNTFETGGTCPNCQKQWASTQCQGCGTWSQHTRWYRPASAWWQEFFSPN